MSKRKTSLKIVREDNGECLVTVTFSDKDSDRHDRNVVLQELLKDASSDFFKFVPEGK